MNGVLGGFKNMLRQWRINLKNKKKKEKNQKKHFKITSFFYSTIAIIYSLFGHIFDKKNNFAKKEKPDLYKKIKNINMILDDAIIKKENVKHLKNIEKQLFEIKNETNKITNEKIKKYFDDKIKKIEIKNKVIKNLDDGPLKNFKRTNKIENDKKFIKENINLIGQSIPSYSNMNEKINNNNINDEKITDIKNFIKVTNNEIEIFELKIDKCELKISTVQEYNCYYDLEIELQYLQTKIQKINENYKELKLNSSYNLELDLDKYRLLKSPKKIDELLNKIKEDLEIIEFKKKEMLIKKYSDKKNQIKEKNNTNTQKDKIQKVEEKKHQKEIDDFTIAKEYILNNVNNQNKYLEKYFRQLSNSVNKKRTIFSSLLQFSKSVLNFTFSLLPITIFKNQLLSTLVSGIMINNSIKTMRKMVSPNYVINYDILLDTYASNKDIIYNTYNVYNNSLYELKLLKEELIILMTNKEITELLFQINKIENNIINQIEKLKLKDKNLDKAYVKIKKDFNIAA